MENAAWLTYADYSWWDSGMIMYYSWNDYYYNLQTDLPVFIYYKMYLHSINATLLLCMHAAYKLNHDEIISLVINTCSTTMISAVQLPVSVATMYRWTRCANPTTAATLRTFAALKEPHCTALHSLHQQLCVACNSDKKSTPHNSRGSPGLQHCFHSSMLAVGKNTF